MASSTPLHFYSGPACPHCRRPLDTDHLPDGEVFCPLCGKPFEAAIFHPPQRRIHVVEVAELGPEGGAVCATHPRNAAVNDCSRCGSFICTLCVIETDGAVYCPPCFDRLTAEGALSTSRMRFRDYGGLAGTLAVFGLLLWFFSFVFGPAAIIYALRGLKQRREQGEIGGRGLVWVALILGLLETIGGIAFWASVFGAFK